MTKRYVSAGEETTDCYGIHHLSIDKDERRQILRRGYAFDCACVACDKDYPVMGRLPAHLSSQITLKLGNMLSK